MPTALQIVEPEQLLKRTQSRCPVCLQRCAAEVLKVGSTPSRIQLRRSCPEHGLHSSCISSDARFYWLSRGASEGQGCCAGSACSAQDGTRAGDLGKNAAGKGNQPFEKLSTCLALIEIVNSCNLSCPTCYANSPLGVKHKVNAVPLEELKKRIQGVIDRKRGIEILQLSGGEPTLHPQFFELLAWIDANPGIDYLLLNTNGIRLAQEPEFVRALAPYQKAGRIQVYLQFDGIQAAGQEGLRGADLRTLKQRAIEHCAEINLPLTLAMTVIEENFGSLWQAVEFGLQYPHIRGISFQPRFASGRLPDAEKARRLNVADVILALVEQSAQKLHFEDFTPLPCGDPNCATVGYLLKLGSEIRSISDFVDFSKLQDFLHDRVRYSLEDLSRCGCESEPLGAVLKQFELDESHTFRLFIKPFMDAESWDDDRIDRCCTHVIRPDGKLDSFCRYYSGFPDVRSAP